MVSWFRANVVSVATLVVLIVLVLLNANAADVGRAVQMNVGITLALPITPRTT